jgi:hypothetical protein
VVPESPLKRYKVFGIVTIIKEMDGGKLIHWLHKRCGRSEQIHTSQKLPKIIKKFPRFVLGGVSKKLGDGLRGVLILPLVYFYGMHFLVILITTISKNSLYLKGLNP